MKKIEYFFLLNAENKISFNLYVVSILLCGGITYPCLMDDFSDDS